MLIYSAFNKYLQINAAKKKSVAFISNRSKFNPNTPICQLSNN